MLPFARLVHCIKFVFLPVFGMRVCPSPRICQFRAIYSADRAPRDWHVASIDSWTGRCSIANRKIVEYFDWRRSHRRPSPFFTNCRYVTTLTSETLECRLPQSRINIKKNKNKYFVCPEPRRAQNTLFFTPIFGGPFKCSSSPSISADSSVFVVYSPFDHCHRPI